MKMYELEVRAEGGDIVLESPDWGQGEMIIRFTMDQAPIVSAEIIRLWNAYRKAEGARGRHEVV
jgi:hypothetical protein